MTDETGDISGPASVPEDFELHDRRSPLTDPWRPIYRRQTGEGVSLGLLADTPHVNGRGFVHGGLISALADNAMGLSCVAAHKTARNMVTVNLSVDFLGVAQTGKWLEVRAKAVKAGRSLSFAECTVLSDGKICARGTSTFQAIV